MNSHSAAVTLAAAVFFGAAGYGIQSAFDTQPTLMSAADHDREWRSIEGRTRAALGRCRREREDARESCRMRARADDRVAKADLDARYYGTVQAEARARGVRARARFETARAECLARGADRAQCLTEARNERDKALAAAVVAAN
jgi:hypothetical protein